MSVLRRPLLGILPVVLIGVVGLAFGLRPCAAGVAVYGVVRGCVPWLAWASAASALVFGAGRVGESSESWRASGIDRGGPWCFPSGCVPLPAVYSTSFPQ